MSPSEYSLITVLIHTCNFYKTFVIKNCNPGKSFTYKDQPSVPVSVTEAKSGQSCRNKTKKFQRELVNDGYY